MLLRRKFFALLLATCSCLALVGLTPVQDAGAPVKASRFAGKNVVITGANRGLGLEFAKQFIAAGANVIGSARKPEGATELAGTGARVLQLDVTDDASVAAFSAAIGKAEVHLLINNAGTSGRSLAGKSSRVEIARFIYDVNTLGPMRVTGALIENLAAPEEAIIVNISSRLGSIAMNEDGGFHGYRESKAALNMFSRSLAAEHQDKGVIAVCVSPGWVRTDMGGPAATLSPQESISGMHKLIEGLAAEDSGKFFKYSGEELAW
ncbi:MAG: NAD(P)-dependent dehydrogenase (short-subunit alcohol dehydrogenase family) [Planctomycetota bacterium]|jgi:NAD(P)-dependent dehydrogenase (short-subunit alcohol dehydrogenase family)